MIHLIWWNSWRENIRKAKQNPEQSWGYCQAAVLSQAHYVMANALYWSKVRP